MTPRQSSFLHAELDDVEHTYRVTLPAAAREGYTTICAGTLYPMHGPAPAYE